MAAFGLELENELHVAGRYGVGALILQQFADFGVGAFLRGMTPRQQIARFARPAGMIYLALLVIFAAMPVLANLPQLQHARADVPKGLLAGR